MIKFLKTLLGIFLIFSFCEAGYSQTRKAIFAEVLGNLPQVSFNYGQRIKPNTYFGLGFRAGLGGSLNWHNDKTTTMGIPLGINYLLGKKQHALEAGLVAVPEFVLKQPEFLLDESFKYPSVLFHANFNIGYRLQPIKDKGLMFNLLWTPVLISSKDIYRNSGSKLKMFSIGVGYSFQ